MLVCSGFSCYEVVDIFGRSPRTIQYWVRNFEQSGFAGLEEGFRPERRAVLDESMLNTTEQDLRQSPRELGYSQNLWDGKLLRHHFDKKFGVDMGERQYRRLFHKLEFRRHK
ncbi:MAG: hypothetical protein HKUEN01_33890 [Candidatus Kuenenia stuttgartiensis]|nr:MAG: hypothetical protein HKUEN01_33890 [Candidatus Kuenenia stuttgartiensis]